MEILHKSQRMSSMEILLRSPVTMVTTYRVTTRQQQQWREFAKKMELGLEEHRLVQVGIYSWLVFRSLNSPLPRSLSLSLSLSLFFSLFLSLSLSFSLSLSLSLSKAWFIAQLRRKESTEKETQKKNYLYTSKLDGETRNLYSC